MQTQFHRGDEICKGKRIDQVIVGTKLQSLAHVAHLAFRAEKNKGDASRQAVLA